MPKGVPNKRYTPEYKAMVIETMQKEHMGCNEAMRAFGITARGQIQKWERIYLTEGAECLAAEHRGRGSKGRPVKLPPKAEEDLQAEVQCLRAENAYLKNLQALVLEDERQTRKKRW